MAETFWISATVLYIIGVVNYVKRIDSHGQGIFTLHHITWKPSTLAAKF